MTACQHCESKFTPRLQAVGGKPQRYCSPLCRKRAEKARTKAGVATPPAAIRLDVRGNSPASRQPSTQPAPDVEWLDVLPDLHRCVAGRMNKARSTFREFAVGMDRPPIGHAVLTDAWRGKVRSNGAVVWVSDPFATADDAKLAVEAHLAGRPELVTEFPSPRRLNLPEFDPRSRGRNPPPSAAT